jgi:hypothetical protein
MTHLPVKLKGWALGRSMWDRILKKKAGVVEHLQAFDHAGLLVNEPPGQAGLPFV